MFELRVDCHLPIQLADRRGALADEGVVTVGCTRTEQFAALLVVRESGAEVLTLPDEA